METGIPDIFSDVRIALQIVMFLYQQSIGPVTIGSHSHCQVLKITKVYQALVFLFKTSKKHSKHVIRQFLISELNIMSEHPFFKGDTKFSVSSVFINI